MSRNFLGSLLAVSIALACPSSASAQSEKGEMGRGTPIWGDAAASAARLMKAGAPADSAYESRALRLESHWGNFRIVQGPHDVVLGKAGLFRTANIGKIVAGSSRAESEARLFHGEHRPGAIATSLGAVTFVVGLVASSRSSSSAATPALMVAGAGGMIWGARRLNTAYTSLSRAVWWYNRDLVAGAGK